MRQGLVRCGDLCTDVERGRKTVRAEILVAAGVECVWCFGVRLAGVAVVAGCGTQHPHSPSV